MTEKKRSIRKFEAKVGLNNDKTGKRFESGDVVTEKDFSIEILEHWLVLGRVIEITQ